MPVKFITKEIVGVSAGIVVSSLKLESSYFLLKKYINNIFPCGYK